jgi:hypothetical protein
MICDKPCKTFDKSFIKKYELVTDKLQYSIVTKRDSVAHMAQIADLEDQYNIVLDADDIVKTSMVAKLRGILKKYDVTA